VPSISTWGLIVNKTLITLGILAAMPVAVASAADMPMKSAAPVPYTAAAYNWTGIYVGVQAGGAWGTNQGTDNTGSVSVPPGFEGVPTNLSGALGGFYGGYNYQVNQYLVGIDGDFSWSGVTGTSADIGPLNHHLLSHDVQMDWITSVTARLGYTNNNWLFFAKGGWAWAQWGGDTTNTFGAGSFGTSSSSEIRNGWTVGAGLEYGVTSHVSLKLEYDYVGFQTANYNSFDTSSTGVVATPSKSDTSSMNIFKGGLAARF
jgi:outer membrane immunogenic protein